MATTLVQLYDHDRPTMKVGMTCLAETDRRHNPYQAVPIYELNYSHLKWEFVWEPLEAVRVISYLSNRSSKRLSSFS